MNTYLMSSFLLVFSAATILFGRVNNLIYTLLSMFAITLLLTYFINKIYQRRWNKAIEQIKIVVDNTANGDSENTPLLPPKAEYQELAYSVSQMAERVNNQLRLMLAQKSELMSILDSINAGVMLVDGRGNILNLNAAFSQLFPAVFTKELHNYFHKNSLEVFNEPELEQLIQNSLDSIKSFNSLHMKLDTKTFQINTTKSILVNDTKEETQLVLIFHDITQLVNLVEIKRDLIANASHELRTPLTAILGYAETLEDILSEGKKSFGNTEKESTIDIENALHFNNIIIKNTKFLDRIVNELLLLSLVENNADKSENACSSIGEAFTQALEECTPQLEEKELQLVNGLNFSEKVAIDADKLSQVFRNLLENAIRYSPAQSPIALQSHNDGQNLSIIIQDYGVGIPKEDLNRVFERFYRVEKHRSHNGTVSTGLGLSLCKHIVEQAKGNICAIYRADELLHRGEPVGATIRFTLPLYNK